MPTLRVVDSTSDAATSPPVTLPMPLTTCATPSAVAPPWNTKCTIDGTDALQSVKFAAARLIVAILLGVIFLAEPLGWPQVVGGSIMLLGLAVVGLIGRELLHGPEGHAHGHAPAAPLHAAAGRVMYARQTANISATCEIVLHRPSTPSVCAIPEKRSWWPRTAGSFARLGANSWGWTSTWRGASVLQTSALRSSNSGRTARSW